ncbi:cytochrome P450 [Hypoxylon sp. FL1150]|nr:cytochrome P450 [Hypoxylon sp. FL1150]
MDVLTCLSLAALEAFVMMMVGDRGHSDSLPTVQTGCILFAIQYLLLKYYRIFLYHKYFSPLRHLPGPTDNHFFFGQSIKRVKADTTISSYVKWMKEHPDAPLLRYISFANTEVLVPASVNALREILQTHCYSFHKSPAWKRMVKEMAGNGVVTMESDRHRNHRRMLNGSFSVANMRKLEPTMKSIAAELSQLFDRAIAACKDGKTGVINCTECFSKTTVDIMAMAMLGIDLGNLRNTTFDGQSKVDKTDTTEFGFVEAYGIVFAPGTLGKMLMFVNGFVPIRWLPVKANRDFLFATSWLDNYITELLRKRRAEIETAMGSGKYESSDSRDFVTFLIEESMPGGPAEGIEESEIIGDVLQSMLAGHETSAVSLAWSLYILAEKPDIQAKLREELAELGDDMAWSRLDKLTYLENFIKESLRVYPPANGTFRQTADDVSISGVAIPKGTLVDVIAAVPQLSPAIWGDDADEVDPTRWDRLAGDQLSPFAFMAFLQGPRICIARAMALMEMKIVLAEVVKNFRILRVEKPFAVHNPGFTLRPNGLEVRFERIDA